MMSSGVMKKIMNHAFVLMLLLCAVAGCKRERSEKRSRETRWRNGTSTTMSCGKASARWQR